MHDTSSPYCFTHHSSFVAELKAFIAKHGSNDASSEEALINIQNLLLTHYYKKYPMFTPKHIGQAQGFDGYAVYWLHMVIPNCRLSRTQFPKAYFYKNDNHISFLCLDSHIQNYRDSELRIVANQRLLDMIEVLKTHC